MKAQKRQQKAQDLETYSDLLNTLDTQSTASTSSHPVLAGPLQHQRDDYSLQLDHDDLKQHILADIRVFICGHSTVWQDLSDELLIKGITTITPLPTDCAVTGQDFEVLRQQGMWAPCLGRYLHDFLQHRVQTRVKRDLSPQLAIEVVRRACGTSALNVEDAVEAFRTHWSLPRCDVSDVAHHMQMASIALGRRIQKLGFEVGRARAEVSSNFEVSTVIMEDSQAAAASVIQNLKAFAKCRQQIGIPLQPGGAKVSDVPASHGSSAGGVVTVHQTLSRPFDVLATKDSISSRTSILPGHVPAIRTTRPVVESRLRAANIFDSKRLKSAVLLQKLPFRPAVSIAQPAAAAREAAEREALLVEVLRQKEELKKIKLEPED